MQMFGFVLIGWSGNSTKCVCMVFGEYLHRYVRAWNILKTCIYWIKTTDKLFFCSIHFDRSGNVGNCFEKSFGKNMLSHGNVFTLCNVFHFGFGHLWYTRFLNVFGRRHCLHSSLFQPFCIMYWIASLI